MTKHTDDVLGHYANYFKAWQVKLLGPKPTREQLDMVQKAAGATTRHGKQVLASAMATRDCGVTGAQIVIACGAPQLNKMRGLVTDGLFKREAMPANAAGHTVYKLTLTAKGKGKVDKVLQIAAGEFADKVTHALCQHSGRFYAITRTIISQPLETPHCLEQILSDESHVCLAEGRMSRLLLHPGQASAHLGNAEDPHLFSRNSRHLRWLGQQLADDGVVAGRRPTILTPLEHRPTIRPPDFAFTQAFRRGTRSAWDRRGSQLITGESLEESPSRRTGAG